jgi:hypothetical protein
MAIIATKFRLEGDWKFVAELLNLPLAPGLQLDAYKRHFGLKNLRPLFGQKKTFQLVLRKLKRVPSYPVNQSFVKKPQRKRGYNDKGHLRTTSLNDVRYWRIPGERRVTFTVNGTKFLPDWYVNDRELRRLEIAGKLVGGTRVPAELTAEAYFLRKLLKEKGFQQ